MGFLETFQAGSPGVGSATRACDSGQTPTIVSGLNDLTIAPSGSAWPGSSGCQTRYSYTPQASEVIVGEFVYDTAITMFLGLMTGASSTTQAGTCFRASSLNGGVFDCQDFAANGANTQLGSVTSSIALVAGHTYRLTATPTGANTYNCTLTDLTASGSPQQLYGGPVTSSYAAGSGVVGLRGDGPGSATTGLQFTKFAVGTYTALTPGTATGGSTTSTTAAATATEATGGTSPYTRQWYRSTTSGQLGSIVSGQTTTTLADTGLTASTTYYYTLKYTDAASLTATSNQITLTTASAGGSSNATGYSLAASPGSVATGSPSTITATLTGGTALSSTLVITLADSLSGTISGTISIANGATTGTATITPSAAGTHSITATHTGGGFSGSDGSTSFTATTGGSAPSAPTSPSATAGTGSVALAWTPGSGATSVSIYRGTTAGGESGTALATGVTGSGYADSAVTAGTAYYYTLRSVNSYGTSAASSEVSATPTAPNTASYRSVIGGFAAGLVGTITFQPMAGGTAYGSATTAGVTYLNGYYYSPSFTAPAGQVITVVWSANGQQATDFDPENLSTGTIAAAIATAYAIPDLPTNPVLGIPYPLTVALNGPAGAAFVATPTPQAGIAWGGPVTIAQGQYYGVSSVTFTAAGAYTPSVAHSGGGAIAADPTLPTVTARAGAIPPATAYSLTPGSSHPVAGESYLLLASTPPGTVLAVDTVVTLVGTNAGFSASQGGSLSGVGTITLLAATGQGRCYFTPAVAGPVLFSPTNGGSLTDPVLAPLTAVAPVMAGGLGTTDETNLVAIASVAAWLDNRRVAGMVTGNVSTLSFSGNQPLSAQDGFYAGQWLTFESGALKGLARRVAGYVGLTRTFQFAGHSPWPLAPCGGDTFGVGGPG